jgi:hypothetical protein
MRQTFHIETGFSEVLFAAPSPVEVDAAHEIVGRRDGTALVRGGLGHDAVYTVVSRSREATAADLHAADDATMPAEILDQYARRPVASARVRALALEITDDAPTTYDKIRAIERWLGAHTEYSIDAPLPSAGSDDVVDEFLFVSRQGWCEQVASSLTVLARSVGIPARLATGFVPGEQDRLTGRFVVRERDAHAWTEIYFPGVGWQGFDPTASVPLAGEAPAARSWLETLRERGLQFGVGIAVLAWILVAAPGVVGSIRRRLRRRTWAARTLGRLERIGRRAGRSRDPAETPREYAAAVAARVGVPRLLDVGDAVDRDAFGRHGLDDEARVEIDEVLQAVGRRRPARAEPRTELHDAQDAPARDGDLLPSRRP